MEAAGPPRPLAGHGVGGSTSIQAIAVPEKPNQAVEGLKDVIYGSIAGIVGKFIEYPFDTIKVRLQSQPDGIPLRYTGPIDCFRQSLQADGFRGLYRGISAPVVGAAVENSSLFWSYRMTQEFVQRTWYPTHTKDDLPFTTLLVCGAVSGAITSLVLTPVELIKCKMQVPASSATSGSYKPPSIIGLIVSVFRNDGILGFWRGQLGTLIRETGGSAAWFGSYEGVSALFRTYHSPSSSISSSDRSSTEPPQGKFQPRLPIYQQMLAGATAGIAYNFLFFPADTIKSRMQTEDVSSSSVTIKAKRASFWAVGKTVYRQHGVAGLYRGCGITCARSAPSSAFIFSIYEGLRYYCG